jgi:hypothetical protein
MGVGKDRGIMIVPFFKKCLGCSSPLLFHLWELFLCRFPSLTFPILKKGKRQHAFLCGRDEEAWAD